VDLLTLVLFILGFVLLVGGANLLVEGASRLARLLGVSPLIIGLTVVAFGTSAPELAVSVQSSLQGQTDLAIGNIVGSNILNILLVLGVAAIITPISVHERLVKLEVPIMIAVSVLLLVLSFDGILSRWDGLLLFSGILLYIFFTFKTQHKVDVSETEQDSNTGASSIILQLLFIIIGLGLLVLGSQWLVDGAVTIAELFGVSQLVIGLTIISIGTSLPELATVVVASLKKQEDLVVGNVVGSNIFNILLVLGATSLVAPNGIVVSETAIGFDMLIMIAVSFLCLPIFFNGKIQRWEGGLFLGLYVAYTTYLLL
jgi:cation:H+ antiporter